MVALSPVNERIQKAVSRVVLGVGPLNIKRRNTAIGLDTAADDAAIASAVLKHFLSAGFRRIVFAFRTSSDLSQFESLQRVAADQPLSREILVPVRVESDSSLLKHIRKWDEPVAVCCIDVQLARKVADACNRLKLAVPDQVAILAWHDDKWAAELEEPTISTARLISTSTAPDPLVHSNDRDIQSENASLNVVCAITVRQSSDMSRVRFHDAQLAKLFIQEHASEQINVADILGEIAVSRSKLERDFKLYTGRSLNIAINEIRIQQAKSILRDTDWPLEMVARKSGFGTKRHFHRVFLKVEKITPLAFRQAKTRPARTVKAERTSKSFELV